MLYLLIGCCCSVWQTAATWQQIQANYSTSGSERVKSGLVCATQRKIVSRCKLAGVFHTNDRQPQQSASDQSNHKAAFGAASSLQLSSADDHSQPVRNMHFSLDTSGWQMTANSPLQLCCWSIIQRKVWLCWTSFILLWVCNEFLKTLNLRWSGLARHFQTLDM